MVLLKILLFAILFVILVYGGALFLMFFLTWAFRLFISVDCFFLTKRLIRYSKKCQELKKLLDYADSRGIKIKVMIASLWNHSWQANWWKRIVFVDFDEIMNPESREMAFAIFAHELGHIASMDRRKDTSCFIKMREDKKWKKRSFGCFLEEWLAWAEGIVILKALSIPVDEDKYWERAFKAVPCHIPCPLWRAKKCPQYEETKMMKENIKNKIEKKER